MILTSDNLPTDMRGYDFNLVLIDADTAIGETICANADDSFTIIINSRLSRSMQKYCFEHALDHVRRHDWEKSNVQEIEYEAHRREK
jgi:hypothetical protein